MTIPNEAIRGRTREAISSQKQSAVTVLSSLHAAHDELGYLPTIAIEEVAVQTNSSVNDVWGVATFYTNFRFTPPAKHAIEICWGPTCHLLGAPLIKKDCLQILGLSDEGNTEAGDISLKYNTCLGACSQAPVVSLDHELFGRLDQESATRLIDKMI